MRIKQISSLETYYPIMTKVEQSLPYLEGIFDTIQKYRDTSKRTVIVGTGISCAVIATYLQLRDDTITYVHLSKPGESTHRSAAECYYFHLNGDKEYWIVDDQVASGMTISSILRLIKKHRSYCHLGKVSSIRGLIAARRTFTSSDDVIRSAIKETGINIKTWFQI